MADYSKLIENYQKTGVFDNTIGSKIAESIGTEYLMIMQIQKIFAKGDGAFVFLSAQIWDTEGANVVFETKVEGSKYRILGSYRFEEAMEEATNEVIKALSAIHQTG